ncbi:hypothetical protein BDZ89DRAFT_1060233 [Hymenopellis radicata]|nr:hypothetical protein BDZ89DRAFT_1060233 [Hymenopellis radicata]
MSRPLVASVNVESPEDIDYKRTVQKQPPPQFSVEILPPTKHGSSHLFGLRISAIGGLNSSRSSRASSYSSDYDVWQLEEHYDRLAREKRHRLLAGKGIKKDGFYKQDAASSWDSLPPGPDPNSVAQHFHDLVPNLTKKGTVFRASQAIIDQRFLEIKAFIEALFKDDQPTLIVDLRGDRLVTDFFGIWRRDLDLQRKAEKERKRSSEPGVASSRSSTRISISSSVFSMYFENASMPSVVSQSPSKARKFSFSSTLALTSGKQSKDNRDSVISSSVVSLVGPPPSLKLDIPIIVTTQRHESRRNSVSSDSSSTSSPRSSTSSHRSLPSVIDDKPTPFGYNPHVSPSGLSALPEDEEISGKSDNLLGVPLERRTRGTVASRRARRSGQMFAHNPEFLNSMQALDLERNNRESWQSHMSGASAYADLGFAFTTTPPRSSRLSVSSVATYMSDSSVDAVLPREIPRARGVNHGRRATRTMSEALSEADVEGLDDYYFSDFPRPDSAMSASSGESRPPGAMGHYRPTSGMSLDSADFVMSSDHDEDSSAYGGYETDDTLDVPMTARTIMPPSPTMSIISSSASSSGYSAFSSASLSTVSSVMESVGDDRKPLSPTAPVTVKAACDKTIIIFRATRDIPLSDARQRIKSKFATQEKILLKDGFTIALAMQESMRSRNSVVSLASEGDLKLITTPEEWRWVMTYVDHSKVTLRVFDDGQIY